MSVVITIIGIVAAALFVYLFVVLLSGDRPVSYTHLGTRMQDGGVPLKQK